MPLTTGRGSPLTPGQRSVLLACELLRALPPAAVDDLLRVMVVSRHAADAGLFPSTEAGRRLWVVLEGRVGVTSPSRDQLLAVLESGDPLGEVQVFDPEPWTFTAVAMTRAVVASAAREDVLSWVARHPAVAVRLLGRMAHQVADKSRAAREPHAHDATVRVARGVLALADRYTVDGVVRHGLTQQQLADIVGLSRERVNKALGEFSERRWLHLDRGRFVLLDRAAVEDQATPPRTSADGRADGRAAAAPRPAPAALPLARQTGGRGDRDRRTAVRRDQPA